MTDTPKVIEIDCSTNTSIERDMTADEIANMQAMAAEAEARRVADKEAAAKVAADRASAQVKLAALGLNADEIFAIIG